MNEQDLKNSILQLAIQGKLVEQRKEEGTAKEFLKQLEIEKEKLIQDKKMRRLKSLEEIKDDEIPFDIPVSWEWSRLESVIYNVGSKKNQITQKEILSEGSIPVVSQSKNLIEGYYNDQTKKLEVTDKVIIFGDHSKTLKMINFDFIVGADGTKIFVPISVVPEYLYYVLEYNIINIPSAGYSRHYKYLKEELIPIPPLEEQKRIVAKIEELIPYAEKYGEAYSKVEELNKKFPEDMQKSILQYAIQGKLVEQREDEEGTAEELYKQIQEEKKKLIKDGKIKKEKALAKITEEDIPFEIPASWKWVKLGEISKKIHYGYTASAQVSGNCKLLRITDIQNNTVNWGTVPFCNVKESEYLTYGLNNRDIMIARTGGTIGKTYIVESLDNKVVFASYLIRVIPSDSINEDYLKGFMESPLYWNQLNAESMGTGQPNVNGTALKNLILPMPPLAEQKRIVAKIEEMTYYTKQLVR